MASGEIPTDKQVILAAHRMFHDEGTIEVDTDTTDLPTARVSREDENSEKGAYVLAWVWVPDDEAREENS